MPDAGAHRCGFVSILGRPNAGKSTLLNALVGARIAIVSDKPQTTRARIQGVLTLDGGQIIFLDTPGVQRSGAPLNRRMRDEVRSALVGCDALIWVIDAARPFSADEEQALRVVTPAPAPLIVALNKIDRVKDKPSLLPLIERCSALAGFTGCVPISAITGDGVEALRQSVLAQLPEAPALYSHDYLTDQPIRFLAAELIREQVLVATHREVPYAVAVLIDLWEESERLVHIAATIYVERDGQKGIIIGSAGSMLKRIGTEARMAIEAQLGRKVFLELHVKLRPDWRDDHAFLDELDWRTMTSEDSG